MDSYPIKNQTQWLISNSNVLPKHVQLHKVRTVYATPVHNKLQTVTLKTSNSGDVSFNVTERYAEL